MSPTSYRCSTSRYTIFAAETDPPAGGLLYFAMCRFAVETDPSVDGLLYFAIYLDRSKR